MPGCGPSGAGDVPPMDPSVNLWKMRHRIIVSSLVFIAGSIAYAMHFEKSEAIAQNVITMGFTTGGGIIGAYVFGKAWENIKMSR
jgi:hypothetical protein